jgi:glyceraldehyde 3-phosphate dehydrogenase
MPPRPRRAMSMIPTTTGAARAVGEVLPELKASSTVGHPCADPKRQPRRPHLHSQARHQPRRDQRRPPRRVAERAARRILAYSDEPLVSIDYNHNPASSTVDSLETAVLEGKLVRVLSWYDNEWGFSNRMVDTAAAMARLV